MSNRAVKRICKGLPRANNPNFPKFEILFYLFILIVINVLLWKGSIMKKAATYQENAFLYKDFKDKERQRREAGRATNSTSGAAHPTNEGSCSSVCRLPQPEKSEQRS